jgi:hypothetical protein
MKNVIGYAHKCKIEVKCFPLFGSERLWALDPFRLPRSINTKFQRRVSMNRNRISGVSFVCICFALLTQPAWGQSRLQSRTLPGHFNNGAVKPTPNAIEDNPDVGQAALTTFGGTFVFKITITVKSTNLGTDTIGCAAGLSLADVNPTTFVVTGDWEEGATVAAIRSGSTATCTVTIPYSWSLANGGTDLVYPDYGIEVPASTSNPPLPSRLNSHSLSSMHVPANGSTTTITVTATI